MEEEIKNEIRDEKGRFRPGHCIRKKIGVRERATQIKIAFYKTFEEIGGMRRLKQWIEKSPVNEREFYKILVPLLPKELDIKGDGLKDTQIILVTPNKDKPDIPNNTDNAKVSNSNRLEQTQLLTKTDKD